MPTCPKTQSQGPASRAWPGGGVRVRGPRGPPRLREGWSLQGQGPQSKGHIPQAVRGSPGSGYKVRLEAGSGGGHESREGPGTSFPRCPLESPASLRRHPLPRLLRCPSPTPPQPLPWPLAPPWPTPSLSPAAPSPGVRSSGGAGRPPRGPGRPLPTPGGSPAGVRPGADQPPSARLPAHGARARGPGSLGSRHLFRGAAAAAAVAAVAAVTGRGCEPTSTRTVDTHVESGRGGARGDPPGPRPAPEVTRIRGHCRAHGWLLVTPEARAGADPPRSPPAPPQCTHPGTGARAPGHPGAPASCTALAPAAAARTVTLQTARQSASPRAPSPSPRDERVFVTCRWAPSRTHPRMSTHPHVPAPTGRAGCKPALLLGPLHSQTHAEGHNRSALPSHVEGPQQTRALRGGRGGFGASPPPPPRKGSRGVGPRGLGLGSGAVLRPRCRPLPLSRAPRPA